MIKHGGCWWAICLNNPQHAGAQPVIGFAGYHHTTGRSGFGYMLHPAHWRQGYASEAVRAALPGDGQIGFVQRQLNPNRDARTT